MLVRQSLLTEAQDTIDLMRQDAKKADLDQQMEIARLNANHELELNELKSVHELEIKQKDFELSHVESIKNEALKSSVEELTKQLAVMTKENEMNKAIIDLEGDVLEVKDVVDQLIAKLPSINLQSLMVQGNNSACGTK